MEDALALLIELPAVTAAQSLNPCFNGRCTRTRPCFTHSILKMGLNPCFNGRCTRTQYLCIKRVYHAMS